MTKTARKPAARKKKVAPRRKSVRPKKASKASRPGRGLLAGIRAALARTPAGRILGILGALVAVTAVGTLVMRRASRQPVQQDAIHATAETPVASQIPKALAPRFEQARKLDVGARMAFWSETIWRDTGVRGLLHKLPGAPVIEDSAPLVPERFDCTTFVETVASLARSQAGLDFYRNLIAIRYREGQSTFLGRNHFPEADWIPNNRAVGIVTDVTGDVASKAGVAVAHQSKEIHRAEWLEKEMKSGKASRSLSSTIDSGWAKPVEAKIDYLPLDEMKKFIPHLPNGAVLNIVRKTDPSRPVMITHQGVVVHLGKMVFLRHSLPTGELRTVRLAEYLDTLKRKGPASWPVVGVNVNRINGAS